MSANRSRSLFAQHRERKRLIQQANEHGEPQFGEALYVVEQCATGARREYEIISAEFMELLRDAARVLNVNFDAIVAPHFGLLADYHRCVYTWRGPGGGWATLAFDSGHAMLTLIGAPRIDKLVGSFAYSICSERGALRLRNVGPYAELLLQPIERSSDVLLVVPETHTKLVLQNETPHRLCAESAARCSPVDESE